MKTKTTIYRNSFTTMSLIIVLIVIAYILSDTHLTKYLFYPFKGDNELTSNIIINKRYNRYLEGSVLDSIYNYDANVISTKQPEVLQKEIPHSSNLYTSSNISISNPKNVNDNGNYNSQRFTNYPDNNYKNLLASINNSDITGYSNTQENHINVINQSIKSNRFEGLVQKYNKSNIIDTDKTETDSSKLIPKIKNWKSTKPKPFYKIGNALHLTKKNLITNQSSKVANVFKDLKYDSPIDNNLLKSTKSNSTIQLDIIKDFSSDPLKSVIQNVLIPGGLPETVANVDAIARGMGLPSGALGSKYTLAGSLGITIEELSNPATKLSSETVLSINTNKDYIGNKLDINNTTLEDYYSQAIKDKFSNIPDQR